MPITGRAFCCAGEARAALRRTPNNRSITSRRLTGPPRRAREHLRDQPQHWVRPARAADVVGGDPVFTSLREQLVVLASRNAIPVIYSNRQYPTVAGGLISYGPSLT